MNAQMAEEAEIRALDEKINQTIPGIRYQVKTSLSITFTRL